MVVEKFENNRTRPYIVLIFSYHIKKLYSKQSWFQKESGFFYLYKPPKNETRINKTNARQYRGLQK